MQTHINKIKTLTVFTPSFNRAYCLEQLYQSLVRQTHHAFMWLIIDDGSTDNTKEVVNGWVEEAKIPIQYHYQENLGMHGAHNAAYRLMETELNVCIDSDDFMPDDAIEKILYNWSKIKDKPGFAGLVGLDANKNGDIIGTTIPTHVTETTMYDLYYKHGAIGDKKIVYRTDVVKKYPPYPIFSGERFVPLGYLYQLIDQDFKLFPVNEVFCIVEYLQDGSSMNMLKQYRKNPKGFAFSRKSRMELSKNHVVQFKNAIHYVASSIFIKNWKFIKESPKKTITVLAIPFGIMLHLYIKYKTKNDF
mgnify:CR=1 FL=1